MDYFETMWIEVLVLGVTMEDWGDRILDPGFRRTMARVAAMARVATIAHRSRFSREIFKSVD